jgi:hypothetical protein
MKTINCETGKKFKELGLTNSQMKWYFLEDFDQPMLFDSTQVGHFRLTERIYTSIDVEIEGYGSKILDVLPAYTLDEIVEMLPAEIEIDEPERTECWELYFGYHYGWYASYVRMGQHATYLAAPIECQLETLVEAAADLFFWCVENGCVKIERAVTDAK